MRPIDADALLKDVEGCKECESDSLWALAFNSGLDWTLQCIASACTISPSPNEPLTIDELREMDGEPVWVEVIEPTVGKKSGWALVYPPNTISGAAVQRWTSPLWYNEYGKTWLAYRFKKEEAHAKHIY